VNDLLSIPVLGREEDTADQVAGFIMLQFGPEVARTAIKGMAYVWLTFAREGGAAYWDVHSTAAQRFLQFFSASATAATPMPSRDFTDRWLTKERLDSCAQEYRQVRKRLRQKPSCRTSTRDLMKQVQSRQWLQPGDGKWD